MKPIPNQKSALISDEFEVLSLLGVGSFGRVHMGRNVHTDKIVAIKIIRKKDVTKMNFRNGVMMERMTLERLGDHPNVIKLSKAFQDDECLYFVLDYVSGGSLADVFNRHFHVPPKWRSAWITDIVKILSHLRSRKVVHNDIKLSNLMIDGCNRLKLIDFNSSLSLTSDNPFQGCKEMIVNDLLSGGTLPYLPPEVIVKVAPRIFWNDEDFLEKFNRWRENNTELMNVYLSEYSLHARDIWSSGCVIFSLLYGALPFTGKTDQETVLNVLNATFQCNHSADSSQGRFVSLMLHPNPHDRIGVRDITLLELHPYITSLMKNRGFTSSWPGSDTDSDEYQDSEATPELGCHFKSPSIPTDFSLE